MGVTLSFDPAKHGAAWALFDGKKELVACGLTRLSGSSWDELPDPSSLSLLVVEVPQVYQQRAWKGDPNDLIDVALVAGGLCYRYRAALEVKTPRPHEWKGSVPKEITARRVDMWLSPREREILAGAKVAASLKHNVVDAIGLGLWGLKRGEGR